MEYKLSPEIANEDLNSLFRHAWHNHQERDFSRELAHSALWVCAYDGETLAGFVKIVWDGGTHGFVLDTTVRDTHRRRGVGLRLLKEAAEAARDLGVTWLHVDHEPQYRSFYSRAGYVPTEAGLLKLGR